MKLFITEHKEIELLKSEAESIVEQMNCDEIFDVLLKMTRGRKLLKHQILDRIKDDYGDLLGGLLHDFFNHKSDANKYLDATEQEDVESDFSEYCDSLVNTNINKTYNRK